MATRKEQPKESKAKRTIYVIDQRTSGSAKKKKIPSCDSFEQFKVEIRKAFSIAPEDELELRPSDSDQDINDDKSLNSVLKRARPDIEVYLFSSEKINIEPHYEVITKSGEFEYFEKEEHDPLPFALAELMDNSLNATSLNKGTRSIDVKMFLQGSTKDWWVCVSDNGKGMNREELNDWAIMRLSKFNQRRGYRHHHREEKAPFTNSDISFFGAGGKQGSFFMGSSVKVITRSKGSSDVLETVLSKKKFQEREKREGDNVYRENLVTRKPIRLDAPKLNPGKGRCDETKESFTHVIVTGLKEEKFKRFKKKGEFKLLCTDLAHVYHYYIHGDNGNVAAAHEPKVQITVMEMTKDNRPLIEHSLHEIDEDPQTLSIRQAAETQFQFRITVPISLDPIDLTDQPVGKRKGEVYGILRYHPLEEDDTNSDYEYDDDDDDSDQSKTEEEQKGHKKKRNMDSEITFDCYWQGRLIPYSTIKKYPWKVSLGRFPKQRWSQVSGVLFTNDFFKVSTNKLMFMDLQTKLRDRGTMIEIMDKGKYTRRPKGVQLYFNEWMETCHEKYDVKPTLYGRIGLTEREGKSYTAYQEVHQAHSWKKQGDKISLNEKNASVRQTYGTIENFLIEGDQKEGISVSESEILICLHNLDKTTEILLKRKSNVFLFTDLDECADRVHIEKKITKRNKCAPAKIEVRWPDDDSPFTGPGTQTTLKEGRGIGSPQAVIKNNGGKNMTKIHDSVKNKGKLAITLELAKGKESIYSKTVSDPKDEDFCFKEVRASFTRGTGKYTLSLLVHLCGEEHTNNLPSKKIAFHVPGKSSSPVKMDTPSTSAVSDDLSSRDDFEDTSSSSGEEKMSTAPVSRSSQKRPKRKRSSNFQFICDDGVQFGDKEWDGVTIFDRFLKTGWHHKGNKDIHPNETYCVCVVPMKDEKKYLLIRKNEGNGGTHAEVLVKESIENLKFDLIQGPIKLFCNYSPCSECSPKLIDLQANVDLDIRFPAFYRVMRPSCRPKCDVKSPDCQTRKCAHLDRRNGCNCWEHLDPEESQTTVKGLTDMYNAKIAMDTFGKSEWEELTTLLGKWNMHCSKNANTHFNYQQWLTTEEKAMREDFKKLLEQ